MIIIDKDRVRKRLGLKKIFSIYFIDILISILFFSSCTKNSITIDEWEWVNPEVIRTLRKDNLKVLDIGNSYSDGAASLLPTIVKNTGADVSDICLYQLVRGGGSFKNWYDIYNNSDSHSYFFHRVLGGIEVPVPQGEVSPGDGALFRRVLSEVNWDIIIIHQVSNYAPYYDLWSTHGEGGYLDELLSVIKSHQPNAQIGVMIVHSYWDNYSGNKEKSSFIRWQKIAESVSQFQNDYDVHFVIPYGTAIENLRSSSYNNEYDLTMDGSHCGYGLCQYAAACCYYESLIAPRVGISCYGSSIQLDVSKKQSKYPSVSITKDNVIVAQKAAIQAVKDMFNCIIPDE
ncbi:MAG: DUF4886 domain-containing protein [Bacteroidales bacterium]|nr:DUF4886 domain-containing protein [Bacteroidales bacterium]